MTNNMEIVQVEKKVWGTVQHIFESTYAAVSVLNVIENTRCSIHYHRYRANQFCVLSGKVVIEQWFQVPDPDCDRLVTTVLNTGGVLVVQAKVRHRFRVIEKGQMVEVYWSAFPNKIVSLSDIVRFDEGAVESEEDIQELKRRLYRD